MRFKDLPIGATFRKVDDTVERTVYLKVDESSAVRKKDKDNPSTGIYYFKPEVDIFRSGRNLFVFKTTGIVGALCG